MSKTVILACGGTAGHLYPARALAQDLKARGVRPIFAGVGLDRSPFIKEDDHVHPLTGAPLKNPLKALLKTAQGILDARRLIRRVEPDLILGFGSYHSAPLLVASKGPMWLFEANTVMGRTNQLLVRKADKILSPFPLKLGTAVKMPSIVEKQSKEKAIERYQLRGDLLTLLVFGGSQGARGLNTRLLEAIKALPHNLRHIQILHIAGMKNNALEIKGIYNSLGLTSCVVPFEDQMGYAYAIADMALARAGAGTVQELIAHHIPALLVPYPYEVKEHQTKNAQFMRYTVGGCRIRQEGALTPKVFATELLNLMERREGMTQAIERYNDQDTRPALSEMIVEEIEG